MREIKFRGKMPSEPKFKVGERVWTMDGVNLIELKITETSVNINKIYEYITYKLDGYPESFFEGQLFATKQELKDFIFKQ